MIWSLNLHQMQLLFVILFISLLLLLPPYLHFHHRAHPLIHLNPFHRHSWKVSWFHCDFRSWTPFTRNTIYNNEETFRKGKGRRKGKHNQARKSCWIGNVTCFAISSAHTVHTQVHAHVVSFSFEVRGGCEAVEKPRQAIDHWIANHKLFRSLIRSFSPVWCFQSFLRPKLMFFPCE